MCGSASVFAKIAMGLLMLAFIFQVIAVATPYWMRSETKIDLVEINVGLWTYKTCPQNAGCTDGDVPSSYTSDAFKATQAFECIVLIVTLVLVVLIVLYVANEKFRTLSAAVFLCIICLITVALAMVGMILWLTQVPSNHYANFSFGFAVVAFTLVFLAAALLIPEIRTLNDKRRANKKMKVSPHNDFSYNRRFTGTPNKFSNKGTHVLHYHNPNRTSIMSEESPPPTYRSMVSPRRGGDFKYAGTGIRTEVMTPDVYLGKRW